MGKHGKVRDVDHGWKKMLGAVEAMRGHHHVKVGVLADNARGGLHEPGADLTVAEIAAVNEFGTKDKHIPERSFVRSTFDEQRESLVRDAAKLLVAVVLDHKMDAEKALNILGLRLASKIRYKIVGGAEVPPHNAPSTVARKEKAGKWNKHGKAQKEGHGVRTLVDTGRMVNAIAWAVVKKGAQGASKFLGRGSSGEGGE